MAQRYVLIVINNGVFLVNPIDHYPSALLRGLTIDSNSSKLWVFFPEALTRKSKTIAHMEH